MISFYWFDCDEGGGGGVWEWSFVEGGIFGCLDLGGGGYGIWFVIENFILI